MDHFPGVQISWYNILSAHFFALFVLYKLQLHNHDDKKYYTHMAPDNMRAFIRRYIPLKQNKKIEENKHRENINLRKTKSVKPDPVYWIFTKILLSGHISLKYWINFLKIFWGCDCNLQYFKAKDLALFILQQVNLALTRKKNRCKRSS